MKTLDKEGVQYTLQRMVTLLAAIQEKVNAPYPEYKEGTWKPKLFDTFTNEVTDVIGAIGFYYKIGSLVFIEGIIWTNGEYACECISGLPFRPSDDSPFSTYPLGITAHGVNESAPFNTIDGSDPYNVHNSLYSPDKTCNTWYVHGWYKIADTSKEVKENAE